MKCKPTLLLLIFFQTFSFSQTSFSTIDIKIEQKYDSYQKPASHKYELIFDNNGHLLKRIGYKIQVESNSPPTDLIQTYTYSDEGLLSIVLEQEKGNNNTITPRFHSLHYYNEKKQLIEMINFNYVLDSIPEKITFDYDANGNLTQINKGDSDYIINQYDSTNKYIKSQLFINNSYVRDLQMANNAPFIYRDIPITDIKTNKIVTITYLRSNYRSYVTSKGAKNKVEFAYYKNGIIKRKKISTPSSYNIDFNLTDIYLIKCDGKTKYDSSIIEKINKEIQQIENWQ